MVRKIHGLTGCKQSEAHIQKRLGHLKGENHPFYGKNHTEETKIKMSLSNKRSMLGKKREECPFWGKHHTDETKEKISLAFSIERKKKMSKISKELWKNPKYREEQVARMLGQNNPMYGFSRMKAPTWRGGISKLPYSFDFNDTLKEEIRKRDDYECQLCGAKRANLNGCYKSLIIHHIDYNKKNSVDDNFIALCSSCNSRANFNRDKWSFLFNMLNEIRLTK